MGEEDMRDEIRRDVTEYIGLERGEPHQLGALLQAQKAIGRAIEYHKADRQSHADESAKMATRFLADYRKGPLRYGSGQDETGDRRTLENLNREWNDHVEDENTTGFVGVDFDDVDDTSGQN